MRGRETRRDGQSQQRRPGRDPTIVVISVGFVDFALFFLAEKGEIMGGDRELANEVGVILPS